MLNTILPLTHMTDRDLLAEVTRLVASERQATAQLIASLMELDTRRLYLGAGCSSLFTYCTQVLRLSEHAAYGRIEAARAARKFPLILELLADGALNLSTVGLLAPHLTPENHLEVLAAARHRSKRDVEHQVARLRPQPAVPTAVRKLPATKPPEILRAPPIDQADTQPTDPLSPKVAPTRPAVVSPLAPDRYKVQLTVSRETYEKLRRAQDLLRHSIPNGDPAAVIDRALTVLIEHLERKKLGVSERPRRVRSPAPGSRHVPAAVKREVWTRDGGQCSFLGTNGRCTETGFLEFQHVVPFAEGGATVVDNLELRCRAHNAYEAGQHFGFGLPILRELPVMYDESTSPDLVDGRPLRAQRPLGALGPGRMCLALFGKSFGGRMRCRRRANGHCFVGGICRDAYK